MSDEFRRYAPLSWQSKRIARVVGSTEAAECSAAREAAHAAILLAYQLNEMLFRDAKDNLLCQ